MIDFDEAAPSVVSTFKSSMNCANEIQQEDNNSQEETWWVGMPQPAKEVGRWK